MKSLFIISFLFLQFFCACTNSDRQQNNTPASENDVDAARNFIRSALDGDYKKARTFIINDSVNNEYLDVAERNYQSRMSQGDKRGYREASINIHSVNPVNDSTSIIHYSNSYKKKEDSVKVLRSHGEWLVDLKYSFPSITQATQ
ncbi:MAG: hypothetical protein ICV53_03795 [Flavisolibacter sp.]|nr:hypothetical protein [Flavisolibacter sp.]